MIDWSLTFPHFLIVTSLLFQSYYYRNWIEDNK